MYFTKKMIKKGYILVLTAFLSFCPFLNAETYGTQQLIPAGHWVYDALFMLSNETKRTSFATNAPISVGELKMYLNLVPYEKLSDSGKNLYDKLSEYLGTKSFSIDMGPVYFGFNLNAAPGVLYKSNSELDWSFATDYTGHKNSVNGYDILSPENYRNKADGSNIDWDDNKKTEEGHNPTINTSGNNKNIEIAEYGAYSSFINSYGSKAFAELPLYLGWSDYFIIHTGISFAKSFWGMNTDSNVTNIFYNTDDMDFFWPKYAYGSAGKTFEKWGVNVSFGRQGLQIGKTLTGSVIYNSTFETEGYFQLNLYSPRMKYNLDVVQVSTDKYLYMHSVEARPLFDWVRFGIMEATLVQSGFELKHLNPLMIMHSFGSWEDSDYVSDVEKEYYGEAHICQYMGISLELTPFKYSRLYFLYAQNEMQTPFELGSANANSIPDGIGFQAGFELTVPDRNNGWWTGTLEGIYTTPFCYIKQGADWSLYSTRNDMQSNSSVPLCSWIGSPFGPDAIGFQTRIGYSQISKWNAELDYLFLAHGTNSFGLFNNTIEIDGKKYYAYYPSVLRKMGLITDEEAENIARTYVLTGSVQFTNRITAKASYNITQHMNLSGRATYSFIFNNKNEEGNFAHGFEGCLMFEYKLFE
ncbi:MAG: hypothetical protein UIB61_01970 [Treponema sp.]|nr:hypothetical protein [Treponema sp.]